jgi:uncharacterized repeat protein (TIGR03806 family)
MCTFITPLFRFLSFSLLVLLLGSCGGGGGGSPAPAPAPAPAPSPSPTPAPSNCPVSTLSKGEFSFKQTTAANRILVFSKTAGFRHDSIPAGRTMLQTLATRNGWEIEFTEDSAEFTDSNLARFDVVVWLSTTGDVLNSTQQTAFEEYIEGGGGYVGIHAAADTEYSWPWYGELVGAYFQSHPAIQTATLHTEREHHIAVDHLAETWQHNDEWYNFQDNPRDQSNVVLRLDESSYNPGAGAMGSDHPIAWYKSMGLGRSFYTGLGHTVAAYANSNFIEHVDGALQWAGRMDKNVPEWIGSAPPDSDFTTTQLASGVNLPMALQISEAGEIYVIGRRGHFYAMEAGSLVEKSQFATNSVHEGGLIGFVLDPNFNENRWAYFHYTHPSQSSQRVSRIEIGNDNVPLMGTEVVLLSYPVDFECCHVAGDMLFDEEGNLFIATGDNTNPFESDGFAPIDERAGRAVFDAQRTSANTNSLRGKILRITPQDDGSYIIPEGNLFSADAEHRGEIYSMGHRNPFRIGMDPRRQWLYWGEIGPDANSASTRGPRGMDEINRTAAPGNFGWPYFAGANQAYRDYDFATGSVGDAFNPQAVENLSSNNSGANTLPNAQASWYSISHRALMLTDIYRWDDTVNDQYKLPSYFHGRLLYWNFNDDSMYEADAEAASLSPRRWLDTSLLNGIIDAQISPHNNRLYVLAYGGNCCGSPANSGTLAEVRYIGDGPEPQDPVDPFEVGDNVSLHIDGHILSADGDNLQLRDAATGNAEVWSIIDAGDGGVAFQSAQTNQYLSVADDGSLNVSADTIGTAQQFEMEQTQSGDISLLAFENCSYLSINNAGDAVSASAQTLNNNSVFTFESERICVEDNSYGLSCERSGEAYLNMPADVASNLSNVPALLSQTGAFADVANLVPAQSLIPYDLIQPLWSDRANKHRWFSIPAGEKIQWQEEGKWQWPIGTVLVKHFELPVDESNPDLVQRLETRLIVKQADGSIYGVTYKWRSDNSDADLLTSSLDEDINIAAAGGNYVQTWTYPSPEDCLTCHNDEAEHVLGIKTASLNSDFAYPSGITDNQIRSLHNVGIFSADINETEINGFPRHANIHDTSADMETRLRSYWDMNCASCHGPQGIASLWDARFETELDFQGIVNGALAGQRDYFADYGLADPRVIDPGDPSNSILYIRDQSRDPSDQMPPIGSNMAHEAYLELLEDWIMELGASP